MTPKLSAFLIAAALAASGSAAMAQARTGAEAPDASTPTQASPHGKGTSRLPPGRSTTDTNKMGTVGPESPVDADAPNPAACSTMKPGAERDACMANARQVGKLKPPAAKAPADGAPGADAAKSGKP